MRILKYINFIKNNTKSKKLLRDIHLFDKILSRSKIILLSSRDGIKTNVYNFNLFYMHSCHTNNHHFMSNLISKKYKKTLIDMLSRNNKDFIKVYGDWKYNQIKAIPNNWSISTLYIDRVGTKTARLEYNRFPIFTDTSLDNSVSRESANKRNLFIMQKLSSKDQTQLNKNLFEQRFKKEALMEELYVFYQKIAYSEKQSVAFFLDSSDE